MPLDPLKACPNGCLFDARHSFCPWCGHSLQSLTADDGIRLENFILQETISSAGGFGVVYRARSADPRVEIEAAVKVLRPNACYDEEAVADFVDEANRTFNLLANCPNAAQVQNADRAPFPYIRMAYVNGGSLYKKLENLRHERDPERREGYGTGTVRSKESRRLCERRMPWRRAYSMMLDIARALEYAHERDMVHRDLKPHNVLIDVDEKGRETMKVVDWGISFARRQPTRKRLDETNENETMGIPTQAVRPLRGAAIKKRAQQITIKYAPPEFFHYIESLDRREAKEDDLKAVFDPRADVYQFGLVAFEVLTGAFPFPRPPANTSTDERLAHWRRQHCQVDRTGRWRIQQFRDDFSPAKLALSPRRRRMQRVIRRCLDRNPARRPATGREIVKGLTEPSTIEKVGVAALVLVVLSVLIGFAIKERPEPLRGIWDNLAREFVSERIRVQEGATGARALNAPSAREAPRTEPPHLRIWARQPGDLVRDPPLIHRETLSYKGASLKKIGLREWKGRGGGNEIGAVAPTVLDPSNILQRSGDTIAFDVSRLVRDTCGSTPLPGRQNLAKLFSIDVTLDDFPATEHTYFLELRFDPYPPRFSVEGLELSAAPGAHGEAFDGKSYDSTILARMKESAPRIFVPAGYADLTLAIRVDDESPVSWRPEATTQAANTGRFEIALTRAARTTRLRLYSGNVKLDEESRLGTVSFASIMRDTRPVPTTDGTDLSLTCSALDPAGEAAREKLTSSRFNFVMVEGPDLTRLLEATLQKVEGRRARVHARPGEELTRYYFYWGFADRRPLQAADVKIERGSYVEFAVPPEARVEKTLSLYAIEKQGVAYPGERAELAKEDFPRLAPWVSIRRAVEIPPEIDLRGLVLAEDVGDAGAKEESAGEHGSLRIVSRVANHTYPLVLEKGRAFLRIKALPVTLELVGPLRDELDVNETTWRLADGTQFATGFEATVTKPGTLTLDLVTKWEQRESKEIQVDHAEELDLLRSLVLKQGDSYVKLEDEAELHVRRGTNLRFAWTVDRYVESVTPGGKLAEKFQSHDGDGFAFALPGAPPGVYRLAFEARDRFGSVDERTVVLSIHGPAPEVTNTMPQPREEEWGKGTCNVGIGVTDSTGVRVIEVVENGRTLRWDIPSDVKEGDVLEDTRQSGAMLRIDEIAARDQWTRQPQSIFVQFLNAVRCGEERQLQVSALDHSVETTSQPVDFTVPCEAHLPPRIVRWLGLNWIFVPQDGRSVGFYISETEIPDWFHAKHFATGESSASDLPYTSTSPSTLDRSLRASKNGHLYLPLYKEWTALVTGGDPKWRWIADADDRSNPLPGIAGSWMGPLHALSNCDNRAASETIAAREKVNPARVGLVPANFQPQKDGAGLFFGALHVLGNAPEVVVDGQGGYREVGGSVGMRIEDCIRVRPRIQGERRRPAGFRLVVYYSSAYPGTPDRQVNEDFVKHMRAPRHEGDGKNAPLAGADGDATATEPPPTQLGK